LLRVIYDVTIRPMTRQAIRNRLMTPSILARPQNRQHEREAQECFEMSISAIGAAIHLLVLGQSNVANHGKGPRKSDWGECWHDGQRYPLHDPLPGASGRDASVFPRLASRLRETLRPEAFAVTVLAQSGTSVADWADGGRCNARLREAIPTICTHHPPVSHILYHQGERDSYLGTSGSDYIGHFLTLKRLLNETWPGVSCIVCTASYRLGAISEEVRAAQSLIQTSLPNCLEGPDTDLIGSDYRFDNIHFNENGLDYFAEELCRSICRLDRLDRVRSVRSSAVRPLT
jgi:hypothetical protein